MWLLAEFGGDGLGILCGSDIFVWVLTGKDYAVKFAPNVRLWGLKLFCGRERNVPVTCPGCQGWALCVGQDISVRVLLDKIA